MRFRLALLLAWTLSAILFAAPALDEKESQQLYSRIEHSDVANKSFDARLRQMLLTSIIQHPVASLDVIDKYDTPKGEIGYCFGRAMAVHLMARRWGLAEESIRKLFVIGDLRSGSQPEWRFHVTTLVMGDDGRWYAIDPIMTPPLAPGTPLLAEKWIATVRKTWDRPRPGKNYHAFYYVTRPSVVIPLIRTMESPILQYATFNPEKVSGFTKMKIGKEDVFRVDPAYERGYFTNVHAPDGEAFEFGQIVIAGERYDYRGYFWDLLQDIINRTRPNPERRAPVPMATTGAKPLSSRAPGLYSPRFPR